jgi:membrane fusion protein, copper/silver efflux system
MQTARRLALRLVTLAALADPVIFTACRRAPSSEADVRYEYFCVMHPQIVQDHPGQCPICQMKLERRDKRQHTSEGPAAPLGDRVAVTLSLEKRQLLGVRSEPVQKAPVVGAVRAAAHVTLDERRVHHVHARLDGYVEHLFVDFTGKVVRRGEPLLALYSPELLATEKEYLAASRAGPGAIDLRESARRRLQLWEVGDAAIRRLEEAGEPARTMILYAPMDGYVVRKAAAHGMRVTPSDILFEIANLDRVWILADVYEQDLARVRVGAVAEVRASHVPARMWTGRVTFIAPTLDQATRTATVRVEVPNTEAALKPEMLADVSIRYSEGDQVVIPESAAVDTGRRQIVFVDHDDGTLEPREVTLGPKVGHVFPVLSGVREGERVVVAANFLLDSESSLRAAIEAVGRAAPVVDVHAGPGAH